jgi:hypothetical protein
MLIKLYAPGNSVPATQYKNPRKIPGSNIITAINYPAVISFIAVLSTA